MKPFDCEQTRDLLPELLGDRLDARTVAALQEHMKTCVECRDELAIARAVLAARLTPRPTLEPRIKAAVRGRMPVRPRWQIALAASIAVAVIGGSAVLGTWMRGGQPGSEAAPDNTRPQGAGWFSVDDAFTSGASSLGDLSVEELERLLVELDS